MTARGVGRLSPVVCALLCAGGAGCAGQRSPASRAGEASEQAAPAAARHPEVDAGLQSCAACHAQVTAPVVAQWSASPHGVALVRCFMCHGSTGADFRARPASTSCRSCHAPEVASVTRDGASQSCFACHAPHSLEAKGKGSPHRAAGAAGGRP